MLLNSSENLTAAYLSGFGENPGLYSSLSLVCALTLVGNVAALIVFYKVDKNTYSLSNVYMLIPCFTGVLIALFNMPMNLYFIINDFKWYIGLPTCYLWYISDLTLCNINIYSFTVLTYIRYATFHSPYRTWKRRDHYLFLAIIFLLPILFWSAYMTTFLTIYPPKNDDCELTVSYWLSYFSSAVLLGAPLLVSFCMNIYTMKKLRDKAHFVHASHPGAVNCHHHHLMVSETHRESRAVFKLLLKQLTFLFCWTPYIFTYSLVDAQMPDAWSAAIYFFGYLSSLITAVISIVYTLTKRPALVAPCSKPHVQFETTLTKMANGPRT